MPLLFDTYYYCYYPRLPLKMSTCARVFHCSLHLTLLASHNYRLRQSMQMSACTQYGERQ